MVLVLNSSYIASLTSILTVQQLSSPVKGIESLVTSNEPIGYMRGSFALTYLTDELSIHRSRLVPFDSPEQYDEALKAGPSGGGVAAVVDERAYLELFLSTRCQYSIIGQEFTKMGWGFVSIIYFLYIYKHCHRLTVHLDLNRIILNYVFLVRIIPSPISWKK